MRVFSPSTLSMLAAIFACGLSTMACSAGAPGEGLPEVGSDTLGGWATAEPRAATVSDTSASPSAPLPGDEEGGAESDAQESPGPEVRDPGQADSVEGPPARPEAVSDPGAGPADAGPLRNAAAISADKQGMRRMIATT